MKRIAAINGSPKVNRGASKLLIGKLEDILGEKIEVYQAVQLAGEESARKTIAELLNFDALLVVFPLYVDSLPAPLIKVLTLVEQAAAKTQTPLPKVYAVCNCGFYEAEHTKSAFRIMRNFALSAGLVYGGGVGIGAGGALQAVGKYMPYGPAANVYAALCGLCEAIGGESAQEGADSFVTLSFPRFLYSLMGNMGWRKQAKQNSVKRLNAKPHTKRMRE